MAPASALTDREHDRTEMEFDVTTISLTPAQYSKFEAKVQRSETGCHLWIASANNRGYGVVRVDSKNLYAHRVAYALAHEGEIPDGKVIDHVCHVPQCVNPMHLRAVTNKENAENRGSDSVNASSGVRGVHRNGKGWRAAVRHNFKLHYTTTYYSVEEASDAAVALRNQLFTNNILDRKAA